jgi:hypothetical protein
VTAPNPAELAEASDNDLVHYLGILEAVVAVLAIKSGLNPETLMGKAIEDITEQAGMETLSTERIIRERWKGRILTAGKLVAQALPETFEPANAMAPKAFDPPVADIPEPGSMVERFRRYQERQKSSETTEEDSTEANSDVTERPRPKKTSNVTVAPAGQQTT